MRENSFDYIIAGGGMAGLSLAFYVNKSPLRDKKILIIDRDEKNTNDHTWCFWEDKENPAIDHESAFKKVIYRRWDKFWFHGTNGFSELLDLEDYQYKMIRAIDFYEFVNARLNKNPNIEFLQAKILDIDNNLVKTDKGEFIANDFVFDSFTRKNYDNPKYHNLWQHFLGWVIKTEDEVFNPNEPTLFDFRIEQKDECRFIYIMPLSRKKALIEFTIFSDNLIEREEYEKNLRKYISQILKVEDYQIKETEFGIIPMSDEPHELNPSPKVIRIGTSGGFIKASTGYSFERTQRRLQEIVERLSEPIQNPKSKTKNWKGLLDSTLLNVLQTKKHPADDVFTHLFKNNPASQVLKFLGEDTTLREDIKIMRSVPVLPFSKAAAEALSRKII